MSFRGGGLGTGNDFGSIVIRNIGAAPCRLDGSANVVALNGRQHPLQLFRSPASVEVPPGLVLSVNAPAWLGSHLPAEGVVMGVVDIMGGERDNPRSGQICAASDEVTPAYWQVTMLGHSWTVANKDPGAGPTDQPQVPSSYACLGNFSVFGVSPFPG
jgi:hypothetical protein